MKQSLIDKPFRGSPAFFVSYLVLFIPTMLITEPYDWELPVVSKIAAFIFLPFVTTAFIYFPISFALACIKSGERGKRVMKAFFYVTLGICSLFMLEFIRTGQNAINPIVVVFVSAWACFMISWTLRKD